jgi:cholest-4-en-3-one 26-monooxygenase
MITPQAGPAADVYDPDVYARGGVPHETFARLRAEDPVYWQAEPGGPGFWAITKYRDLQAVSLDQKTFASWTRGISLRELTEEEAEAFMLQLINMPPGQHMKYRRLVNTGFTPKLLRNVEGHTREMVTAIIDAVAARGRADFVTEIAAELPLQVIAEMTGVPLADRHKVFDWTNQMIGFDDPEYREHGKIASAELFMYAHELATERLAHPRNDLASVLMHAVVDGQRLTVAEFNAFFLLLLVAGNETTRNLISGGMLALIEHPEERARLMADRALLPTAVEEMLRWVSPVNYMRRTATRDVTLRGKTIRAGDKLALFYASANRDEEIFPDARRFDVGRAPNEHLAFGFGPHFCLGAHLARLEIRIMFEELLRRLPDIALDGPVERLRSNFINGIKRMPVRFTPARVHLWRSPASTSSTPTPTPGAARRTSSSSACGTKHPSTATRTPTVATSGP